MDNINCYLKIIVCLLSFFCVVLLYIKFKKSNLVELPISTKMEKDSRYQFPNSPPVNPITKYSQIISNIPPNSDLFTPFNDFYEINDSDYSILTPNNNLSNLNGLNELDYSGGHTQLIKIPLQMNEPNQYEQLRSQNILVTPYNKVKY